MLTTYIAHWFMLAKTFANVNKYNLIVKRYQIIRLIPLSSIRKKIL